MICKNCGRGIERVPESASETIYWHKGDVGGVNFYLCSTVAPLSEQPRLYDEARGGFLRAEPVES